MAGATEQGGDLTKQAEAKAKAEGEAKAKLEAEAKAKAEARASDIKRLREAIQVLEPISNAKAPLKSVEHHFDSYRRNYLDAVKRILIVLGREDVKDPKTEEEKPVSDAAVAEALVYVKAQMQEALGAPYVQFHREVKSWLGAK